MPGYVARLKFVPDVAMTSILFRMIAFVLALLGPASSGASAADQIKETERSYAIAGSRGIELYQSIGRHGPGSSIGSASIAQTTFKLTWKRLFDERGGDCHLVSARPVLTITYIFPKPSGALPSPLAGKWQRFISGVRKHEQVHGRMIREMVAAMQSSIAGAVVQNDRTCSKVKREVSRRLDEAAVAHKKRSVEFDRVELSDGGNVHRLILALVNE